MKFSRLFLIFSVLLIALFALHGCGSDDDDAKIRVIHSSYDAPAVDVYVGDRLVFANLAYGESSGYSKVSDGNRTVKVVPAGETAPVVIETTLALSEKSYTIMAVNQLSQIEPIFSMDKRSKNSNKAKVRFIHASPDAPAVDVRVGSGDGPAIFSNVAFKDIEEYIEVDGGSYSFVVTPAGTNTEVVKYNPITLENGNVYTVVASGTLDALDEYDFRVRAYVDNDAGAAYVDLEEIEVKNALVRVFHSSYDAPAVDVYIDGDLVFANLEYGESSGYGTVPEGGRTVKVVPAGEMAPAVIEATLSLTDTSYTVLAVNQLNQIEPIFSSDERTINNNKAKARFIHASPDAPAVDIRVGSGDGPAVFSNVAFKDIEDYIEVDGGDYSFVVTPAGTNTEVIKYNPVTLENGKVYTIVASGTLDALDDNDFMVRAYVDNDAGAAYVDLDEIGNALVRVVHSSYDAPAVDVYIDDALVFEDLAYGESSGYGTVSEGDRTVKVVPAGEMAPAVIEATLSLTDTSYTVLAVNQLTQIEPIFSMDKRASVSNKAKARFIHASADAPAVDIRVGSGDGPAVFSNVAFKDIEDYIEVDGGDYSFVVTPAGTNTEVFKYNPITLENGKVYTIVASGTLDALDDDDFMVRAYIDNNEGTAYADLTDANLMVVHASPDAPGVDLLLNDTIVGTNLEFPNNTGYLGILSGTRNVKVNVTGTATTVIEADLPLDTETSYTVFAIDEVAEIAPLVLEDDLTPPAAGKAHVRFVHLSPDAPAVDIALQGGAVIFADVAFGESDDDGLFTPLDAGTYDLEVRVADTMTVVLPLPGITLEEGKIYTVFAKGFAAPEAGEEPLGAEIIVNN